MTWDNAMPGPRILRVRLRKSKGGRYTRVWSNKSNDSAGNESVFDERRATSEGPLPVIQLVTESTAPRSELSGVVWCVS